tara:strand:- start:5908 stop:7191 length:1284 start_codon:yes stop_codon:yes gene_type:complete
MDAKFSPRYLAYVVLVLFLMNIINYMDRSVIGVLVESIKHDLKLSDTQIGLLNGMAFALFYATAGLFMARIADLYDRRLLMSVSILIWTIMAAGTGLAANFLQFFVARMCVGVGESGAIPTANAMLADYFPPHRRPLAIGIVTAGAFFGILAGSALGGYVAQHYGWRMAFVVAALPGLPVAALIYATIKDPPRGGSDDVTSFDRVTMRGSLGLLLGNRSYVRFVVSGIMLTFLMFGMAGWFPAFLMRAHGLSQSNAGFSFGLALGLGAAGGMIGGGFISTVLARQSLRWLTRMPLYISLTLFPLFELAIYAPTATTSLLLLGTASALCGASYGPVLAALQTVIPPNIRAVGAGLSGLAVSSIGLGGAPLLIGMLSDHFQATMGAGAGLQRALAIAALAAIGVVFSLLSADRVFSREYLAARQGTQPG